MKRKLWKLGPIQGSVVLAIVGIAMVATAGAVLVSNVLHVDVNVTESPVQITQVDLNVAYPDLSGSVAQGLTYEMSVDISSVASVGTCELEVNITRFGITPGDVTLQHWTGSAWESVALLEGTSSLYARMPDVVIGEGYHDVETFAFTFAVAGDFDVHFMMYAV